MNGTGHATDSMIYSRGWVWGCCLNSSMIDPDHQQAYSTQYRDPKLMDADLRDWEVEDNRSGDWIHLPSGIRIGMTGRMGRWVIQYPTGRYHKAPGSKRPSYYAKLSKAIGLALDSLKESRRSFVTMVEQSEDMVEVYHITRDTNLPAIRRDGLVPQLGPNSQAIGETSPAVHVFLDYDTLTDAIMNWDTMDWFDDEPDLSMLTLKIPKSWVYSPREVSPILSRGTGEIYRVVPPSMITSIAEFY